MQPNSVKILATLLLVTVINAFQAGVSFRRRANALWMSPRRLSDVFRELREDGSPTPNDEPNNYPSEPSNQVSTTTPKYYFPPLTEDGVYLIKTKEEHAALLKANPDKIVVIKFYATFCRACAALEPRYHALIKDPKFQNLPIVWAKFQSSRATTGYFRRLGILTIPTFHFYDGGGQLVENFPCSPSKFVSFKRRLTQFINARVDKDTRQLKERAEAASTAMTAATPKRERVIIGDELITQEHLDFLRDGMPFFQDLTDKEFSEMLKKARLRTYLPGDVIIRQGMSGNAFFVIKSGVVEMCIRSRFEDPISTPPSYLGPVVNQLGKFDFFGERALTTGEPLAASIRALEKTRCFAFDVDIIPESCILSKKRRATRDMVEQMTKRYELPKDYVPPTYPTSEQDRGVLELLVRFKQVRQVARCFEYIISSGPMLQDQGGLARRSVLVTKLTPSRRQEFVDIFNIIADVENSGIISYAEVRRFMASARKQVSDRELIEMMSAVNPLGPDSWKSPMGITLDGFLGVMAESYFYYLFRDTFQELDKESTGYVAAGDLNAVLDGVRDLISDDRKSVIDVEDQEIQVDYEQFARMLLGAT